MSGYLHRKGQHPPAFGVAGASGTVAASFAQALAQPAEEVPSALEPAAEVAGGHTVPPLAQDTARQQAAVVESAGGPAGMAFPCMPAAAEPAAAAQEVAPVSIAGIWFGIRVLCHSRKCCESSVNTKKQGRTRR
jgi:hypothetical protein